MRETNTESILLALVYFTFLFMVLWVTVQAIPAQEPAPQEGVTEDRVFGVTVRHAAFHGKNSR